MASGLVFMVKFWDDSIEKLGAHISVLVHASAMWSTDYFLDIRMVDYNMQG